MSAVDLTDATVRAAGVCVSLGGMPVLRQVGIVVRPGELVALTGGNGSGKSTLIRALLRLVPTASGDIAWFGTPLASFADWARIGYVPQRDVLHGAHATVSEIVSSGLLSRRGPFQPLGRNGRARVSDALARVELADRAGWPLAKLSGGQLQRALIARALVGSPDALVLDEPMAGVDLRTQDRLADIIGGLKDAGLSVLVVLHEQGPLAGLIDHTVELHDGRLVHEESH